MIVYNAKKALENAKHNCALYLRPLQSTNSALQRTCIDGVKNSLSNHNQD
jgi:hypothetical protein